MVANMTKGIPRGWRQKAQFVLRDTDFAALDWVGERHGHGSRSDTFRWLIKLEAERCRGVGDYTKVVVGENTRETAQLERLRTECLKQPEARGLLRSLSPEELKQCLRALGHVEYRGAHWQEVIDLRFRGGMTLRQAGKKMGMTAEAVRLIEGQIFQMLAQLGKFVRTAARAKEVVGLRSFLLLNVDRGNLDAIMRFWKFRWRGEAVRFALRAQALEAGFKPPGGRW